MERDEKTRGSFADLPPADAQDPVIDAYKKDIDRTLLRENLRLTPGQRLEQLARFLAAVEELRRAEAHTREERP